MFARVRNSWTLIKASADVLRADKELIVFPIVSAIGVLIVTASFALPMFVAGFFDSVFAGEAQILGFFVGFLFYIVQYFVIIFANSALVGAAMIRLRGGDPTVGDGFRIAMQHIGAILGYAYAGLYRPRPAYRSTVEDSVYVAPDAQGRGVGRELLRSLIGACEALDFRLMVAVIGDEASAGSIRLHESLGFVRAGVLPGIGFKHGRWLATVLMHRPLGPGQAAPPTRPAPG